MEFAALEVQIFVSLALVLGALFVALLTDFLKGNNEALRERNIELFVRQEERQHAIPRVAVRQPQALPALPLAQQPALEPELPHVTAATPVLGAEPEVATASAADVAPPGEEWATTDEIAAVDAIAARIRESIDSQPAPAQEPEPVAEESEKEEILAAETVSEEPPAEEPEPEIADEPVVEEAVVEEPAGTPAVPGAAEETEPVAGAEQTEPVVEETVVEADAEQEEPAVEVAGAEEAPADEEPPEEEVRNEEEPPRFTVNTKVTPIDVVATERSVVAEALKLARELERVADLPTGELTDSETGIPADMETEIPEPVEEAPVEESKQQGVTYSRDLFKSTPEPEEAEPAAEAEAEVEAEAEAEVEAEEFVEDEVEEPAAEASEPVQGTIPMPAQEGGDAESLPAVKVPTGYQEYSVLAEAIASKGVFRGTTVAIGVSEAGGVVQTSTVASVGEFVESLLTPADFGCQHGPDEFLVILPEEMGAQAQRRLQYLSQRLWDFQIRTVGTHSIMFSWGAAEISDEPLEDAIEAAKDRMLQTKRTRERATSEIHHYRMRAAND